MPHPRLALLLLLASLLPLAARAANALPAGQIKLEALADDTQRMSTGDDLLELVWWLPPAYWEVSVHASGLPESSKAQFLKAFEGYVLVAHVQGKMGAVGVDSFADADASRAALRMVDPKGATHAPLADKDVPSTLKTMLEVMKPILAGMIGPMGTNMHFSVFRDRDAKGAPLFDPLGSGHLKIITSNATHDFRLPLGSLLQPRRDAATGDVFPGDYLYSPYTGAPLQTATQP